MTTPDINLVFYFLLFAVAFLYSSVGHGGASGYLALMALFAFEPQFMKSTAFILNIFVAGIAFVSFYKGGWFRWRLILPFAITSIPFAYLGSYMNISVKFFNIALAVALIIAAVNIVFFKYKKDEHNIAKPNLPLQLLIGAVVGLFSGMLGIGGGIVLSPLFIIFKWGSFKEIACTAALFVFINSASGLFAQINLGLSISNDIWIMIPIAIVGGIIGSYSGGYKLSHSFLKYALSIVLLIASIKLSHAAL